jgi:CBS-domain-containing membrane protein
MQLAVQLNELGVARTHPNPYFEHFANAMARRTPRPRIDLTKEDIDAQAQLADEVLAEVISEERADLTEEPK